MQRQTPNLRTLLVRSRFHSTPRRPKKWGSGPCKDHCANCQYMGRTSSILVTRMNKTYELHGTYDCTTSNVVYVLTCKLCKVQYVGEMQNKLLTHMAQHQFIVNHNDQYKPVACHYNSPGHCLRHMSMAIIRHDEQWSTTQRKTTERAVIVLYQSAIPFGLNVL